MSEEDCTIHDFDISMLITNRNDNSILSHLQSLKIAIKPYLLYNLEKSIII